MQYNIYSLLYLLLCHFALISKRAALDFQADCAVPGLLEVH